MESEINRLVSKHGELNSFLQERTTEGWGEHVIDVAMQHILKIESENKRLREALEIIDRRTMSQYLSVDNMVMDFKRIAREALDGDPK